MVDGGFDCFDKLQRWDTFISRWEQDCGKRDFESYYGSGVETEFGLGVFACGVCLIMLYVICYFKTELRECIVLT